MGSFVIDPKDPDVENVRARLHQFIDQLPKSKPWKFEWKQFRKERSDPQHKYLNGVAYAILSEELGFERDDISEYLCGLHFGWVEKKKIDGSTEQVPYRTTTTGPDGKKDVLDWKAFDDYVEFIKRWAVSEKGIYIPDPDPAWRETKEQQRRAA